MSYKADFSKEFPDYIRIFKGETQVVMILRKLEGETDSDFYERVGDVLKRNEIGKEDLKKVSLQIEELIKDGPKSPKKILQ